MATQVGQRSTGAHSLPNWFIKYQDNAGLTILLVSLMGINAVVYGSGVVPNILRPQDWGLFRTILFVLFCGAGTVMPGLALRFGVGMFIGHWFRRMMCALLTVVYFVVEVWASVTERSLTTITTPADTWLMQVLHAPAVPFSPTVLAISLSLSLAVVGWGIATTPPQLEDLDTLQNKLAAKQMIAEANAKRITTSAAGSATAAHAAFVALRGRTGVHADAERVPVSLMARVPSNLAHNSTPDDPDDPDDGEDDDDEDGDDGIEVPPAQPTPQPATARTGTYGTPRGAVRTQAPNGSYRFQRVVGADVVNRVVMARTPVLRVATA